MGLYYQIDLVLRWYEANEASSARDLGRTRYTVLNADTIKELRDDCATKADIQKWLQRNQVPPDGYEGSYDGVIDLKLLSHMVKTTEEARTAMRAYIFLDTDEPNSVTERTYSALNELRTLFVPVETRDQHTERLLAEEKEMPRYIAERFTYTDECLSMLLGLAPQQSNYLAVGYVLSCIWADIVNEMPEDIGNALSYASREYKSGERKQQGDTVSVYIPWWENPESVNRVSAMMEEQRKKICKNLTYYRVKGLKEGEDYIRTYPGAWQNVISKYECAHAGPIWKRADEMLGDIVSNPGKYIRLALDDFVNMKMRDMTYNFDSRSKKKQLLSPTIEAMMYAMIADELSNNIQYRKCLLCNRYFQVKGHKTRIYCDVHRGSNAKYYRRKWEKENKIQHEE
ncbi:hypothetical protein [Gemmiger sp.]